MAGRTLPFAVCRSYGPLEAPPARNFIMHSGEQVRLLLTVYERDGDSTPVNLAGMAAFFSFGTADARGSDGVFLPFETGQVYFDLMGAFTRYGRGQIPWRVTLGDATEASVVASGVINVARADGHRFIRSDALITPGNEYLDGDDTDGGGVIGVPQPGSDVGPLTLLWDDASPLLWEDGDTVDYA